MSNSKHFQGSITPHLTKSNRKQSKLGGFINLEHNNKILDIHKDEFSKNYSIHRKF